jgi:hypothetical protein
MTAVIDGKWHQVTTYEVNGRRRHIVEKLPHTTNLMIVNRAIRAVQSFKWADVWNWIDSEIERNGGQWSDFPGLERKINKLTV